MDFERYVSETMKLLSKLEERKDSKFIQQLYTILYRYLEKKGRF